MRDPRKSRYLEQMDRPAPCVRETGNGWNGPREAVCRAELTCGRLIVNGILGPGSEEAVACGNDDRQAPVNRQKDNRPDSGRERLNRAAYELFSREGVRSVGVDAVIARAGTAKMTLYRNFPSKDDLILEF